MLILPGSYVDSRPVIPVKTGIHLRRFPGLRLPPE